MQETLLQDLTNLRDKCQDLVESKDREQAFSIIYDNLKASCKKEVESALDVNPALAEYVEDFSGRMLRLITEVKRIEDFSIQKALGKIELASDLIETLSIKKPEPEPEPKIKTNQPTRESRGIRAIGERPMGVRERSPLRDRR
jgi:hypothetical protein